MKKEGYHVERRIKIHKFFLRAELQVRYNRERENVLNHVETMESGVLLWLHEASPWRRRMKESICID